VVVNLVIPKGADSVSHHLKKLGNGLSVEVAHSETANTSGPPASVTIRLRRGPPLAHFENIFTFPNQLPFSGKSYTLNSTTDRPSMDNPETSIQEAPTPELATARTCQISGSQRKTEVLKLHRILRKRPTLPTFPVRTGLSRLHECKNGILPLLDSQHVQTHVNRSNYYCL
jgi:hypothetical protein